MKTLQRHTYMWKIHANILPVTHTHTHTHSHTHTHTHQVEMRVDRSYAEVTETVITLSGRRWKLSRAVQQN